jgi:putative ubiquitin-RnfH superfamily antitoxin RatB of RatAB toxin-antitoxin module
MGPAELISVVVAYSPQARAVQQVTLSLQAGATVEQAVLASALVDVQELGLHVGVWGRKSALSAVLREGDRVEIYRPLTVDPKEARRVRYRAHVEKLPKGHRRTQTASQLSKA